MKVQEFPRDEPARLSRFFIAGAIFVVLVFSRTLAGLAVDFEWWEGMGQLHTWTTMWLVSFVPLLVATLALFAVLWMAHAHAVKGVVRNRGAYGYVSALLLLGLAWLVAAATLDSWTVVRFLGGRGVSTPDRWMDPLFGNPLRFYFFELPFYRELVGFLIATALSALIVFWITSQGWRLMKDSSSMLFAMRTFDARSLRLDGLLESAPARVLVSVSLAAFAINLYFGRYDLVFDPHTFMTGADYVDQTIRLPLQWTAIAAALFSAIAILARRPKLLAVLPVVWIVRLAAPFLVSAFYVGPNELALERPFIQQHLEATRAAFHLDQKLTERQYPASLDARVDTKAHAGMLDNVRLWDWRAFHDTVTQLQALRQYYVFHDTDVDRYRIDGKLRQLLLTPRELDLTQLGEARGNWINTHFVYTHGYGAVVAEANRITPDGSPVLLVQDAPPKINTPDLRITRPEIYFGEVTHEPVFTHTRQPEFNYPSGSENVHTNYESGAGIGISPLPMRLAAALSQGDWNLLFTSYLAPESRMLIRTNIRDRLSTLAPFMDWDTDPYMVITDAGRLVWMVDGYTTSNEHPYSQPVFVTGLGSFNYIRNSVKATVDAYDGTTKMYVFDPADPLIQAWQSIFPTLFLPSTAMPADIRRHARYPEMLFLAQARTYRAFHMRSAEQFYNKEDLWEVAKNVSGQNSAPEEMKPAYVIASVPGGDQPEFVIIQPFTPRSKDNLIGLMVARCDGDHLGEIQVLQLSKQNLIYGPLQVESRIDSDQTISKDLSLWNQQGSSVLRGNMLVLPAGNTFLYVEPIYIHAAHAKMPELKKIVAAVGNAIYYRDTYAQVLGDLGAGGEPDRGSQPVTTAQTSAPSANTPGGTNTSSDKVSQVRLHLERYRQLSSQGKWAEAGRELEAIQTLVQ